ncbi:DDE Tnp4 domain-containing protein [Trichonephila inaurata madagascariensis]|uniref:DDE Tnp4 domain-containing protein n=1 Tax=Trichonephila inaurata madagascariensis TaxID=2747483 RepID=A0A8X6XV16_9ARAC|nr:DDE Tnp4 domain-containing protein [Trichonephila inaurata madagascariensis]
MDDLDVALVMYLEDEQSSEEESRSEESELFKNRSSEGAFEILVRRHLHCNDEKFRQYFRLTPVLFDYVLNNIREELTSKPYNRHKKPICPEEKLCILVRHLATGESFRSLAFQYRVSHSGISVILREVVDAIIKRMLHVLLPTPTMGQFQKTAQQYYTKWNFPNCIGAIDGKHVRIKAPKNSGSLFYSYKDYHSMVMLAVVDADCKFTAVDVGSYGREGDAGIFLKSEIGRKIKNNTFNVPPPKALPGTDTVVPHVIVGDEAFALHQNLMKPYPRQQSLHDASKAVYNYRLSRARRTTENAFGILCSYFRLFFRPISTAPETTEKIIICACILHNILREAKVLAPGQTHIDSALPLPVENFLPLTEHNVRGTTNHTQIREMFKNYFNGPGAVEWQKNYAMQH